MKYVIFLNKIYLSKIYENIQKNLNLQFNRDKGDESRTLKFSKH